MKLNELNLGTRPVDTYVGLSCSLVVLMLCWSSLTNSHSWGDDFAAYIMQAKAISEGSIEHFVERNTITVRNSFLGLGPITYPWGYPLILTPIYKTFGLNLTALKIPNAFFLGLFVYSAFFLLRKRLSLLPRTLVVLAVALHPVVLMVADNIISDITFLALSTLCLAYLDYLFSRREVLSIKAVTLTALIFVACQVRTVGYLLVPVVFLAQALEMRAKGTRFSSWTDMTKVLCVILPYLLLLIFAGLVAGFLPDKTSSYLTQIGADTVTDIIKSLIAGAYYYIEVLHDMFTPPLFTLALVPLTAIGARVSFKKDILVISYIFISFLCFALWPAREGARFLLSFLIPISYWGYLGLESLMKRLPPLSTPLIFIGLVAPGLLKSFDQALQVKPINLKGPFHESSLDMFSRLKILTPQDAVVGFFKPRALRLMTDRLSFTITDCQQLADISYLVTNKEISERGQLNTEQLSRCPQFQEFALAYESPPFVIHSRRPSSPKPTQAK